MQLHSPHVDCSRTLKCVVISLQARTEGIKDGGMTGDVSR